MKNNHYSSFTISLDFELFWGVIDSQKIESYGKNIKGVKKAIPEILLSFKKHRVKATWGIVSSILCDDYEHWKYLINRFAKTDNYKYFKKSQIINLIKNNQEYFFSKELVHLIRNDLNQEIGSHTFSHYINKDNSIEGFIEDMKIDQHIMNANSIHSKSFIFPRNYINLQCLNHLSKIGFKTFRGNPNSFLYSQGDYLKFYYLGKILRYLDNNFGFLNTFNLNSINQIQGLVNIPATHFLSPVSNNYKSYLQKIKLRSILKKMNYCARNNINFHLWWHPHNFGSNLKSNVNFLEQILNYFDKLREQYGMQSKNMSDFI